MVLFAPHSAEVDRVFITYATTSDKQQMKMSDSWKMITAAGKSMEQRDHELIFSAAATAGKLMNKFDFTERWLPRTSEKLGMTTQDLFVAINKTVAPCAAPAAPPRPTVKPKGKTVRQKFNSDDDEDEKAPPAVPPKLPPPPPPPPPPSTSASSTPSVPPSSPPVSTSPQRETSSAPPTAQSPLLPAKSTSTSAVTVTSDGPLKRVTILVVCVSMPEPFVQLKADQTIKHSLTHVCTLPNLIKDQDFELYRLETDVEPSDDFRVAHAGRVYGVFGSNKEQHWRPLTFPVSVALVRSDSHAFKGSLSAIHFYGLMLSLLRHMIPALRSTLAVEDFLGNLLKTSNRLLWPAGSSGIVAQDIGFKYLSITVPGFDWADNFIVLALCARLVDVMMTVAFKPDLAYLPSLNTVDEMKHFHNRLVSAGASSQAAVANLLRLLVGAAKQQWERERVSVVPPEVENAMTWGVVLLVVAENWPQTKAAVLKPLLITRRVHHFLPFLRQHLPAERLKDLPALTETLHELAEMVRSIGPSDSLFASMKEIIKSTTYAQRISTGDSSFETAEMAALQELHTLIKLPQQKTVLADTLVDSALCSIEVNPRLIAATTTAQLSFVTAQLPWWFMSTPHQMALLWTRVLQPLAKKLNVDPNDVHATCMEITSVVPQSVAEPISQDVVKKIRDQLLKSGPHDIIARLTSVLSHDGPLWGPTATQLRGKELGVLLHHIKAQRDPEALFPTLKVVLRSPLAGSAIGEDIMKDLSPALVEMTKVTLGAAAATRAENQDMKALLQRVMQTAAASLGRPMPSDGDVREFCCACTSDEYRSVFQAFVKMLQRTNATADSFGAGPAIALLQSTQASITASCHLIAEAAAQRQVMYNDLARLQKFAPSIKDAAAMFAPDVVDAIDPALAECAAVAKSIIAGHDELREAYEAMHTVQQLRAAATELSAQAQTAKASLQDLTISRWAPAAVPVGVKPLAEKWGRANQSHVFRSLWTRATETTAGADVRAPEAAFEFWRTQMATVEKEWAGVVKAIKDKTLPVSFAADMFRLAANIIPRVAHGLTNSTEARREANSVATKVEQYFRDFLEAERVAAVAVLATDFTSSLNDAALALRAKSMHAELTALGEVARKLGAPFPAGHPITALAALLDNDAPIGDVAAAFDAALQAEGGLIGKLPMGFLSAVDAALVAHMPRLCQDFPSHIELDKVVRRRQMASDAHLHGVLDDFLEAHSALSQGSPVISSGFEHWKKRKFTSNAALVHYLIEVSWAGEHLAKIAPQIQTVENALAEDTPVGAQTTAESLLHHDTTYRVVSRDGRVELTAKDPQGHTKTVSDMTDAASQLVLTGHTADRAQTDSLSRFVALHEVLVKKLVPAVQALVDAGHPQFQSNSLPLSGDVEIGAVEAQVEELALSLRGWRDYFTKLKCPVLTLFGRRQLVDVINAAKVSAPGRLHGLIKAAVPLAPDADIAARVMRLCQKCAGKDTNRVYEALGKALDELAAAHGVPAPLPEALVQQCQGSDDVRAAVGKLSAEGTRRRCMLHVDEDGHELALLAVFAAVVHRAPAAFEVLQCTAATTPLTMEEYMQRWVAMPVPQAVFAITHADTLTPEARTTLVEMLAAHARGARFIVTYTPRPELVNVCPLGTALRDATVKIPASVTTARGSVAGAVLTEFAKARARVVESATPQSGKTRAVLAAVRERARDSGDQDGGRLATFSTDGSVGPLVEQLGTVRERVYHLLLNVAHSFEPVALQAVLFSAVVLHRIKDDTTTTVPIPAEVCITIELPSEGIISKDRQNRLPLLQSLERLRLGTGVSQLVIDVTPIVVKEPRVCDADAAVPPDRPDLDALDSVIASPRVDTAATQRHQETAAFFKHFLTQRVSGFREVDYRETIVKSADALRGVDEGELARLCRTALRDDRAPLGKVYRFWNFLTSQLYRVLHFDSYAFVTADLEAEDKYQLDEGKLRNYRVLAYHLADLVVDTAVELAAEAVAPPQTAEAPEDERLANLSVNFENWREVKFAFFTAGSFELASVGAETRGIYEYFQQRNRAQNGVIVDTYFERFVTTKLGQSLDSDVAELRSPHGIEALGEERRAGLRKLLPILAAKENHCESLFSGLEKCRVLEGRGTLSRDAEIAMCRMDSASEAVYHAAEELAAITGNAGLRTGTVGQFQDAAKGWLKSLMALPARAPPFLLTQDSLVRLLAIKARVLANVPVVFQGVTGCGKTELADYYARIAGAHFECINVFDGTTPQILLRRLRAAVEKAGHGRKVVILLDEANAMHSTWVAKELLCDRVILGHRVPESVTFICTVNPWKQKANKDQTFGLEYALESHGTAAAAAGTGGGLLYDVQRMPESLLALVWDYGMPQNCQGTPEMMFAGWPFKEKIYLPRTPRYQQVSEELAFAISASNWLVEKSLKNYPALTSAFRTTGRDVQGKDVHLPFVRTLVACLFEAAQCNLREQLGGEATVASLRDLRVVRLVDFFLKVCFEQARFRNVAIDGKVPFQLLSRSILAAFVLNFELRLDDTRRRNFDSAIAATWQEVRMCYGGLDPEFLPAPQPGDVYAAFDAIAEGLCGCLPLDEGMAINQALKENALSLFACIMGSGSARALIIVGRPGSSKSSSLDALVQATVPTRTDEGIHFFQGGEWTNVRKHVVQCTPHTTADDILRTARTAAEDQHRSSKRRCVLVLEEVGIAAASRHHPLRVLHGLVDRGVECDNGKVVPLPVIGISNWALDAAKMTRMRLTQRANPSFEDLVETGRLLAARQGQGVTETTWIEPFAEVFARKVLSRDADREMQWFYGMRDFYAFVSMVQQHTTHPLETEVGQRERHSRRDVDPHLLWWAAQVNFGGIPSVELFQDFVTAVLTAVFGGRVPIQNSRWKRRVDSSAAGADIGRCDSCARAALYLTSAIKRTEAAAVAGVGEAPVPVDDCEDFAEAFGATQHSLPCTDPVASADEAQSTNDAALETVAYCLRRRSEDLSRRYRPRNLLLLTRGASGLTLLFEKGLLSQASTVVVVPKPPRLLDDTARFEDLSRVRRCLAQPVTIVLVRAWHLYEPLYEVLNQHFTVEHSGEHTRYFVSLALNTTTMEVQIHPDCRIVLVEDEARLNELKSPFLNRCVKVRLCYDDALRGPQRRLHRELKDFDAVNHDGRTASLLDLLVPGFCTDTLASLAYFLNDPDHLDVAVDWLAHAVSARRLAQVLWGLYEGTDSETVRGKIVTLASRRNTGSAQDAIVHARYCNVDAEDDTAEPRPHLLLLTEQRELMGAAELLRGVFGTATIPPPPTDLLSVTDEDRLTGIAREAPPGVVPFWIDLSSAAGQQDAAAAVERAMRLLTAWAEKAKARDGTARNVVIIGVLPSTTKVEHTDALSLAHRSKASECFHLVYDPQWAVACVDELTPANDDETVEGLTLGELMPQYDDDTEELVDGAENITDIIGQHAAALLRTQETAIVQALTQQLRPAHVEAFDGAVRAALGSEKIVTVLFQLCLPALTGILELRGSRWRREALLRVTHSETLRGQLTAYLGGVTARAVYPLLRWIAAHDECLTHVLADDWRYLLWEQLVSVPAVVPAPDARLAWRVDLPLGALEAAAPVAPRRVVSTRFPFAWSLHASIVAAVRAGMDATQAVETHFGGALAVLQEGQLATAMQELSLDAIALSDVAVTEASGAAAVALSLLHATLQCAAAHDADSGPAAPVTATASTLRHVVDLAVAANANPARFAATAQLVAREPRYVVQQAHELVMATNAGQGTAAERAAAGLKRLEELYLHLARGDDSLLRLDALGELPAVLDTAAWPVPLEMALSAVVRGMPHDAAELIIAGARSADGSPRDALGLFTTAPVLAKPLFALLLALPEEQGGGATNVVPAVLTAAVRCDSLSGCSDPRGRRRDAAREFPASVAASAMIEALRPWLRDAQSSTQVLEALFGPVIPALAESPNDALGCLLSRTMMGQVVMRRRSAAAALQRCTHRVAEAAPAAVLPLYRVLLAGALTGAILMLCTEAVEQREADVVTVDPDIAAISAAVDATIATIRASGDRLGAGATGQHWVSHAALFALRVLSREGVDTAAAAAVLGDPETVGILPQFLREDPTAKRLLAAPPPPTALVTLPDFVNVRAEVTVADANLLQCLRQAPVATATGYCLSAAGVLRGVDAAVPAAPALLGALADITRDESPAVRLGRAAVAAGKPHAVLGGVLGPIADECADAVAVFAALAEQHGLAGALIGDLYHGRGNLAVGRRPADDPVQLFVRVLECFAAALGAVAAGAPAVDLAEVQRHRHHIHDEYCQLFCPHCRKVFGVWTGCCLVHCQSVDGQAGGCGRQFCGWCLAPCNGYDHVQQCQYSTNRGQAHGSVDQIKQAHKERTIRLTREYLGRLQPAVASAVVADLLTDLQDLTITPADLGVRPRLAPTSIMEQAQIAFDRVKAVLLRNATDAAAAWWVVGGLFADPGGLFGAMAGAHNAAQLATAIPAAVADVLRSGPVGVANAQRTAEQLAQQQATVDIGALQWRPEYERSVAALPPAALARHFAVAQPESGVQLLLDHAEGEDELRPLRYLYDVSTRRPPVLDRRHNETMCSVLATADRIAAAYRSQQLTEADAAQITVAKAAATAGIAREAADVFVLDMWNLLHRVDRWNCRDKAALEALFPPHCFSSAEELKLVFILPSAEGPGLLLQVLLCGTSEDSETWQSVQPAQATALEILRKVDGYPVAELPASSMAALHKSRVATHDTELLRRLLPLYIDPAPVPAVSADVATLQALVVHTPGVWGKPSLPPELPLFPYRDTEGLTVFQRVLEICPPEQMGRDMHQSAAAMLALDPAMPANTAVLVMLLVHDAAATLPGTPRAEVLRTATLVTAAEALSVPLTPQQQDALATLRQSGAAALRLSHATDLLKLCLGDVPMRDAVMTDLPEDLKAPLEAEAAAAAADTALDVAGLLFGFRRLSLERLMVPQTEAFYDSPLGPIVESCVPDASVDALDALPSLLTVSVRYTAAVEQLLIAAWRGRGGAADEREVSWVVPFAQLREVVVAPRQRRKAGTRRLADAQAFAAVDGHDAAPAAPAPAPAHVDPMRGLSPAAVHWEHDPNEF